jgi:hypothetical protein
MDHPGIKEQKMTTDYLGPERRRLTRRGWRSTWLGLFLGRLWSLVAYSDTTPTRFMLAWISVFWAVMLAWPGDTLSRPVYIYLAEVAGEHGDLRLAAAWSIAAAGMFWRVFAANERPWTALILNSYHFMLYAATLTAIFMSRPFPLPAAIAGDIVCLMASAWVLVRTHINSEAGWRRD